MRTWPQGLGFLDHEPDVLRRFFHLARQVQGRRDGQVRIRPPDFDPAVEALDVDLGRGHGLLADAEALGQTTDLWRRDRR